MHPIAASRPYFALSLLFRERRQKIRVAGGAHPVADGAGAFFHHPLAPCTDDWCARLLFHASDACDEDEAILGVSLLRSFHHVYGLRSRPPGRFRLL